MYLSKSEKCKYIYNCSLNHSSFSVKISSKAIFSNFCQYKIINAANEIEVTQILILQFHMINLSAYLWNRPVPVANDDVASAAFKQDTTYDS